MGKPKESEPRPKSNSKFPEFPAEYNGEVVYLTLFEKTVLETFLEGAGTPTPRSTFLDRLKLPTDPDVSERPKQRFSNALSGLERKLEKYGGFYYEIDKGEDSETQYRRLDEPPKPLDSTPKGSPDFPTFSKPEPIEPQRPASFFRPSEMNHEEYQRFLQQQVDEGAPPSDKAALEFVLHHSIGEIINAEELVRIVKEATKDRPAARSSVYLDGILHVLRSEYGIRLKEVRDPQGKLGLKRQIF